jgi:hypothetical protein
MQLNFRGHDLVLDPAGALFWPARATLVVADLHLEKGAAFARRGTPLPPYDTHATLARLEDLLRRWGPKTVVSLGDGFHDRQGPGELSAELFDRLIALARSVRWVWVTGNHDPSVAVALGGAVVPELTLGGVVLRHAPTGEEGEMMRSVLPPASCPTSRVMVRSGNFAAVSVLDSSRLPPQADSARTAASPLKTARRGARILLCMAFSSNGDAFVRRITSV